MNRRSFLQKSLAAGAAVAAASRVGFAEGPAPKPESKLFRIALADSSFRHALATDRPPDERMDFLDFPRVAKVDYGLNGIEVSSQYFRDKVKDRSFLGAFRQRADDLNVSVLLLRINLGPEEEELRKDQSPSALGAADPAKRRKAVELHQKWLEAAQFLGCRSVRVSVQTWDVGSPDDQQQRAADGVQQLCEKASKYGLNVLVENHGGRLLSNGGWLAGVVRRVGLQNCGTLPAFGRFEDAEGRFAEPTHGVQQMLPYARAISAQSFGFDRLGEEGWTDYRHMLRIVLDSGYRGWVGIDYDFSAPATLKLPAAAGADGKPKIDERARRVIKYGESEGVLHTKWLLERIQQEFSA